MKIIVLDGYTLNPGDLSWDELGIFGELTVYDRTPRDLIVPRAAGCGIVLTNKIPLDRETITALPEMRYIGVLATGYNVVDLAAARERGIVVTNTPAYATDSVTQMVFAHLLEICHQVRYHDQAVKKGQWKRSGDFCFWNHPMIELAGKTMGIIGMGRIGRAVVRIAEAFGMKIIAFDPDPKPEPVNGHFRFSDLDGLLRESDVITLHCPLTESNRGFINRNSIAKMKDGVILINTSRGPLIVEEDLAEALKTGKVAAAGLDVLQTEPPEDDHFLFSIPNCIITPHIAWAPIEARARLLKIVIDNILAFLDGKPVNVVN